MTALFPLLQVFAPSTWQTAQLHPRHALLGLATCSFKQPCPQVEQHQPSLAAPLLPAAVSLAGLPASLLLLPLLVVTEVKSRSGQWFMRVEPQVLGSCGWCC
jgi:hypothetical protein